MGCGVHMIMAKGALSSSGAYRLVLRGGEVSPAEAASQARHARATIRK